MSPKPRNRNLVLDAMRGAAILLVLLRHSWPSTFPNGGVVGVVLFFALSGYLITNLLIGDLERLDRINYRRFYRNRILRLYPALIFFLAVLACVTLTIDPLNDRNDLARQILIGLTYTADLPGLHLGSTAIGHLWTLALEEQYYLVWPLLLTFIWPSPRRLVWVLTMLALALAMTAATILWSSPTVWRIYSWPTSWVSAMLVGSTLAVFLRGRADSPRPGKKVRYGLTVAGVGFLAATTFSPITKDSPLTYLVVCPAVALAASAIIVSSLELAAPSRAMTPLLYLGKVSYAAYLWNYPICLWIAGSDGPASTGSSVVILALTLGAAWLSWELLEAPIARLRARWDLTAPFPVIDPEKENRKA